MISTCKNDFNAWTQKEQIDVRSQFLNGDGLDKIGKNCHRHAKTICLELIRQGLIQEENNIAKNHIRFNNPYNLRYVRKDYDKDIDLSDSSSEYTPSEHSDESDESISEHFEYEEGENIILSDSDSEDEINQYIKVKQDICEVENEDFDLYNIRQQVEIVFKLVKNIRNYLKTII
jgi:hypothetical protein